MDSHFNFNFTMPSQSFDGLKATEQGNTASGFFDEGLDTTTGSIFGQQSFDSIFDNTIDAGFSMEQPLVSVLPE
jgi:hypothetical protein